MAIQCWHTTTVKTGVPVLSFLLHLRDFNDGNLQPLENFEGMGFMPIFYSLQM